MVSRRPATAELLIDTTLRDAEFSPDINPDYDQRPEIALALDVPVK